MPRLALVSKHLFSNGSMKKLFKAFHIPTEIQVGVRL